jgi:hypothetical protein
MKTTLFLVSALLLTSAGAMAQTITEAANQQPVTGWGLLDTMSRHPLFILLMTALISGFGIPRLTRWWHDNQKDVETRAKLLSDANAAVVKIIVATQIAERGTGTPDQFREAYIQWEINKASLESQFRVYYSDETMIADRWVNLCYNVTDLYVLTGITDLAKRNEYLVKLTQSFPLTEEEYKAVLERDKTNAQNAQTYIHAWWKLRNSALKQTSDFLKSVYPLVTIVQLFGRKNDVNAGQASSV